MILETQKEKFEIVFLSFSIFRTLILLGIYMDGMVILQTGFIISTVFK